MIGLAAAALPAIASPASAITCGTQWTQGSSGPNARDYQWGNCGTTATTIRAYSLTYGGAFKTLIGESASTPELWFRSGGPPTGAFSPTPRRHRRELLKPCG